MRSLRISFLVSEEKAGPVLASLATEEVQNLHFEVVEDGPVTPKERLPNYREMRGILRNGNGHAPGELPGFSEGFKPPPSRRQKTGLSGRSAIPAIFRSTLAKLKKAGEPLTTSMVKKTLLANKMAPGSFSHALYVLQSNKLVARKNANQYEVL